MSLAFTKRQIKEAIAMGTINPKILVDFFNKIKLRSYQYDYLIQQQLVDLNTARFDFQDCFNKYEFVKDGGKTVRMAVAQVNKDIVHYAKRKLYKTSSVYNKPLTNEEIMNHREIFKFGVLCFINGKLETNFKIQAREDKTLILFPSLSFAKTVKAGDVLNVVFLPDSIMYTSRVLTTADRPSTTTLLDLYKCFRLV